MESNIAHSIATFSELGIATSALLITDVAKWKEAIRTIKKADPIKVESLLVNAKELGGIYYLTARLGRVCDSGIFRLTSLVFIAPFLSLFLACYTLFGIALYPAPLFDSLSFLSNPRDSLDKVYLLCSFASFLIALAAACMGRVAERIVTRNTQEEKIKIADIFPK